MPDKINDASTTGANGLQPGQVVTPGASPPPVVPPPTPIVNPQPSPAPTVADPAPTPVPQPQPEPATQTAPQGLFNAEQTDESFNSPELNDDQVITWTASEYVEHEKNGGWYLMLTLASIGLAAIIFLITRDKISAGVVIFGAIALGVYGARPPRQLTYQLNNSGLTIGQKSFNYDDFRSFAVVPEGAFSSIVLVHHKRFAPLTTIYCAPDNEDQVIDMLAKRLPVEEHKIDAVEHLMRRIRF